MISKILLLLSITFNTFGFAGQSAKIDRGITADLAGSEQTAQAAGFEIALPDILAFPIRKTTAKSPLIYAKNYILSDADTGVILEQKSAHDRVPIASTTKIMTASVVLDDYDLDDVVTISAKAAAEIGATANFRVGEKITVLDLLKCLLIKSANGAAYALAEHMNGPDEEGISKFIKAMNQKARELGMDDTDYHDPAGLDVTGYSSANDLVTVTKYAYKYDIFAQIVLMKEATVTDVTGTIYHTLENSNRLVGEWDYPGAIGVKTGYMPEAGHCLVGAAERDGHTLISVVLNTFADTPTASAEEARRLLDWGWANVSW